MPKKKTGARKKAEKQAQRQKTIRDTTKSMPLGKAPCNAEMVCDSCGNRQKNRAFCYFCASTQRLPMCAQCGRTKCMGGDCLQGCKHSTFATGMSFVGAICDFCEAWVCHSRKCITTHACSCVLRDAHCIECDRGIWDNGGRFFRCVTCDQWLCDEDQLEHQASCLTLDRDTFKCVSCSRVGAWSCLRCKVSLCDDHVKRKGVIVPRGETPHCRKCSYPMKPTIDLAISVKTTEFGRHRADDSDDEEYTGGGYDAYFAYGGGSSSAADYGFGGYGGGYGDVERASYDDDSDESSSAHSDSDEDENEGKE